MRNDCVLLGIERQSKKVRAAQMLDNAILPDINSKRC